MKKPTAKLRAKALDATALGNVHGGKPKGTYCGAVWHCECGFSGECENGVRIYCPGCGGTLGFGTPAAQYS